MVDKLVSRFLAATLFVIAPVCQAGVIWDELSNGDLSTSGFNDFGTLSSGSYDVIGTLDAGSASSQNGPDERDGFQFTVVDTWSMDIVGLIAGTASTLVVFGNETSSGTIGVRSISSSTNDVYSGLGAGTYRFSFVPQGNIGTLGYTARINVDRSVPEPSVLFLFGIGLAGVLSLRGRAASKFAA